ncbi:MAG TPA: PAS domain-containing sensor histidine kinase [Bacteroidetes bacterium]|nr:PAS domain-containing sensor histidine kinase [Bacteroidota bacterium]
MDIQKNKYDLTLFFELSLDLMCIAGYDGYFKKVNTGFEKLLGYSMDELLDRPVNAFIHPDDVEITSKYRDSIRQGKPLLNFENRYVTKSGEVVWLTWTSIPHPQHELVYAIAKNITHRKKIEDDRNSILAKITMVNDELKRLTYSTSHDLRSPVNNLIAAFSLLDVTKVQDQETVDILNLLKLASQGLNSTLNTYVDTLVQKDKNSVEISESNFQESLSLVTQSLSLLIKNSNTQLKIDFSKAPTVMFNRGYLDSIFLNLISNAIKYAKPQVNPIIQIWTEVQNNRTVLYVKDNGIGFDLEKIGDKIFGFNQKFHKNKDSKGIGLYLVRNHVESLGGSIKVESNLNDGSLFIIKFGSTNDSNS